MYSTCWYVLVHTSMYWYKPVHTRIYQHIQACTSTYLNVYHELHYNSFSNGIGFRGAIRDEPGLSERYVPAQESVLDEDLDRDPCEEDEEFFESRPNAEQRTGNR